MEKPLRLAGMEWGSSIAHGTHACSPPGLSSEAEPQHGVLGLLHLLLNTRVCLAPVPAPPAPFLPLPEAGGGLGDRSSGL